MFALQIQAVDTGLAKKDVEMFSVGNRSTGTVPVPAIITAAVLRFGEFRFEFLRPNLLACFAVEANHVAHQFLHVARIFRCGSVAAIAGHVDAVVEYDRAGCSQTG